VNNTNL